MINPGRTLFCGGVLAAAVLTAGSAQAALQGETVNFDRVIPSIGFSYDQTNGLSGNVVAGVSGPLSLSGGNNLYVTAGDHTLTYDFGPGGGGLDYPDHAIIFTENALEIVGLSVFSSTFSSLTGFSPSALSFGEHTVALNISHLVWGPGGGNTLVVKLQFAAIPEPTSWAMLIMGFGGIGGLVRRRRMVARNV
jgi:hypothetical protein